MKESISYTFLLNIVILFIFVCTAIIMGVLSYYKAFRANSIISESIEKYEGYNCLSKEEIARRLSGLGYNTPFDVSCKSSDGNCDDSGNGYKVIAYNLDFNGNLVYEDEPMNSTYKCETIKTDEGIKTSSCTTNKNYQFGIYTYMYVEMPVISKLIRIPVFSKTSVLYEFRNFHVETTGSHMPDDTTSLSSADGTRTLITDVEQVFDKLYKKEQKNGKIYVKDAYYGTPITVGENIKNNIHSIDAFASKIQTIYTNLSVGKPISEGSFMDLRYDGRDSYRSRLIYKRVIEKYNRVGGGLTSQIWRYGYNGTLTKDPCGTKFDYSKLN